MTNEVRNAQAVLIMLGLCVGAVVIVIWLDRDGSRARTDDGPGPRSRRVAHVTHWCDDAVASTSRPGTRSVKREKVSAFRRSILLDPPLRQDAEPGVLSDRRQALVVPFGQTTVLAGPRPNPSRFHCVFRPTVNETYDERRHGKGKHWTFQARVSLVLRRGRQRTVLAEVKPWYRGAQTFQWEALEVPEIPALEAGDRLELGALMEAAQEPYPLDMAFGIPRCVSRPAEPPWSVLLISLDAVRADHLSCHGRKPETSALAIDRMAREGVRFARALSPSNWSMTSYGTLLSGLHPPAHRSGLFRRAEKATNAQETRHYKKLNPAAGSVAEHFRDAGFSTAAFHANLFLEPWYGFDRGFDTYVRYHGGASIGADLAIEWLTAHADTPSFVMLHLMDAHFPYDSPKEYRERFGVEEALAQDLVEQLLRANAEDLDGERWRALHDLRPELKRDVARLYDAAIAYCDAQVNRLLETLERLGRLERTVVVIHSDHGEGFWEHGEFRHGRSFHAETVHVPLIVRAPGRLPQGVVIDEPVSVADLPQTLIELFDLPALPLERPGSLLAVMRGEARAPEAVFSSGALFRGYQGALWDASGRYVLRDDQVLHYALDDLREERELDFDRTVEIRQRFATWVAAQKAFGESLSSERTEFLLSPEMERELKALGYFGN